MIITHLGHACLLVETGGTRILLDPGVLTPGFEEIDGLDVILITHQHADHLDPGGERIPALMAKNPNADVLVEPSCVEILAKQGVDSRALPEGESAQIAGLKVTAAGHEHAEIFREIPRIGNVGLLVEAPGEPRLFHPGDSYATVPDGVDILAAPLSAPWAALKETIDFVRAVKPTTVFPIHDRTASDIGRGMYYSQLGSFLPDGATIQDLASAGPTTF